MNIIYISDVVVGSLLGLFISYLCYRQYYPGLTSPYSHVPYLLLPSLQHRLPINMDANSLEEWERNQVNGGPIKEIFDSSPHSEDMKWI